MKVKQMFFACLAFGGLGLVSLASCSEDDDLAHNDVLQSLVANMVEVEGGEFYMGSYEKADGTYEENSEANEHPLHLDSVSTFSIGKYEVTQAEWKAVMGNNPSFFQGENLPVENVSWYDCQEFISRLNAKTGMNFRLPTEAEWEYAAGGGKRHAGYTYAGSDSVGLVAWYINNAGDTTHEVGQKQPNQLGLYDMSGNVWEWCADYYDADYYAQCTHIDPVGPDSTARRVYRGGGYWGNAKSCRIRNRRGATPKPGQKFIGLRLAL